MSALKTNEVERFVRRPDLEAGIVLIYGPDGGLVRETAQQLIARFGGAAGGMGLVTLDGGELDADPERLLVEAQTASLFGERRIVRLRGAGKSALQPLKQLAADPAGAVIIVEAGNLAPREPLRALVEAAPNGRALPCYPDNDQAIARLVAETLSGAGIVADPDVPALLRDLLGNDREITRRELEKLVLFAADSRTLTRDDVMALCGDNAALALDDVVDAVGTGHAGRLEAALSRALAAALDPQMILAVTSRHFAQLRRWRLAVDAGTSPRDVLAGARPKPHFSRASALEQQLRLWSDGALAIAGERLHQATGDSRRNYGRAETITRRVLLALTQMAALH